MKKMSYRRRRRLNRLCIEKTEIAVRGPSQTGH